MFHRIFKTLGGYSTIFIVIILLICVVVLSSNLAGGAPTFVADPVIVVVTPTSTLIPVRIVGVQEITDMKPPLSRSVFSNGMECYTVIGTTEVFCNFDAVATSLPEITPSVAPSPVDTITPATPIIIPAPIIQVIMPSIAVPMTPEPPSVVDDGNMSTDDEDS